MTGMKVTLDAAMRARDVSRPHPDHDALADAGEPRSARDPERGALPAGPAAAEPDPEDPGAVPGGAGKGRSPRRRRRRR